MPKNRSNREQDFEDLSSYSSSREYMKGRKNKKLRMVLKVLIALFSTLLIIVGVGMIYVSTDLLSGLRTRTISKDQEALGINSNLVIDDSVKSIAVFGLDARNSGFRGNSDMIMIATIDNLHKKIKLTSVLRDSNVLIEGLDYDKDHVEFNGKINSAYDVGGPELAIRTLNQNFNLNISDYVTVNITNLSTIVEAFGGVDITLTSGEIEEINKNLWALSQEVEDQKELDLESGTYRSMTYPEIGPVDYMTSGPGGTFHLNGNQAIAYGRIRNIGDDVERVTRQQQVVYALLQQVETAQIDYLSMIKKMMPLCETSLGLEDMFSLTPILTTTFGIETISVPDVNYEVWDDSEDENGESSLKYDLEAAQHRIDSFIKEDGSLYWDEYNGKSSSGRTSQSSHEGMDTGDRKNRRDSEVDGDSSAETWE